MSLFKVAGIAAVAFLFVGATTAEAAPPARSAGELAHTLEQRAAKTNFAKLETFGQAAYRRNDREGLNRLYHVTWTILNQGEFERAAVWNEY